MFGKRLAYGLSLICVIGLLASPAVAEEDQDIVDTAVANGSFTKLCEALEAAGLVETLKGPGPFTVFAPTDAAFEKITPEQWQALKQDKAKLARILRFHVIPGRVASTDVMKLGTARSVGGKMLTFNRQWGTPTVQGALITRANIPCRNGVIHVIDTVLMPESE